MATIKYINYGIGFRVDNTIYLNKNLQKYPKLHEDILKHELKHIYIGKSTKKNIIFDLKEKFNKEILFFCLRHPLSFIHFFPIIKVENNITISWLYLYLLIFIIGWFYFVWWVCVRFII